MTLFATDVLFAVKIQYAAQQNGDAVLLVDANTYTEAEAAAKAWGYHHQVTLFEDNSTVINNIKKVSFSAMEITDAKEGDYYKATVEVSKETNSGGIKLINKDVLIRAESIEAAVQKLKAHIDKEWCSYKYKKIIKCLHTDYTDYVRYIGKQGEKCSNNNQ